MTGKKKPDTHFTPKDVMGNPEMLMTFFSLDLTENTRRILAKNGIVYLGHLLSFRLPDLLRFDGCNRRNVNDIEAAVGKKGYQIGQTAGLFGARAEVDGAKIREIFEIPADQEYAFSAPNRSPETIEVEVRLPTAFFDTYTREFLKAAIQGKCQSAFNVATENKKAGAGLDVDMSSELEGLEISSLSMDPKLFLRLKLEDSSSQQGAVNQPFAQSVVDKIQPYLPEVIRQYAKQHAP